MIAKVVKILAKGIGSIVEWLLILLIVFAFAIRTSPVQTFLADFATDFLSRELNTTIKIDQLDIVFIDRLALDGVLVMDQHGDTLAYINTLYAKLDNIAELQRKVTIEEVNMDGGVIHLSREKSTGDYNYWFIQDYFDSGPSTSKKKPITVELKKLKLADVDLRYDDYRKSYSDYGVDFDHIDLKRINLEISNLESKDGNLTGKIKTLSLQEKSGFDLTNLTADLKVSDTTLNFNNLKILTDYSDIKLPRFALFYHDREDFQTFEDSVTFDALLSRSRVSLKDVSYFATALEGMDQELILSAKVKNKVKNLNISDLQLKTGKKTYLAGDFILPDFRKIKSAFYNERIKYAYISLEDLQNIKMPVSSEDRYMALPNEVRRLAYIQAEDIKVTGIYSQFVVSADEIKTQLGAIEMPNGLMFSENRGGSGFRFEQSMASEYDVKINSFDLGTYLNNSLLGKIDGIFFLSGIAYSTRDIDFTSIQGNVNRFDFNNYSYTNIEVKEGSLIDDVLLTKVDVKDDNLNLEFEGTLDLKHDTHMKFEIDLAKALLTNLNITTKKDISLKSNFIIDLYGTDPNKMKGRVTMDGFLYKEGDREIYIPKVVLSMERGELKDHFHVDSELGTVDIIGKVDFENIGSHFANQFSRIFPALFENSSTKTIRSSSDNFSYEILTGELDEFLGIFVPDLKISPQTKIKGSYNGKSEALDMTIHSGRIDYTNYVFRNVSMIHGMDSSSISADYKIASAQLNDSVTLQDVHFTTQGSGAFLDSRLTWNPASANQSDIHWQTVVKNKDHFAFTLEPSFFSINQKRWDIKEESKIDLNTSVIDVQNFQLERNEQFVKIFGKISKNDGDKLNFEVNDLDLDELSILLGLGVDLDGKANSWGYISNPYTNLKYMGDASILGLYINKEEVGDVFVQSQWEKEKNSIGLTGDLMYRGAQTFAFNGLYHLDRESENLDFFLDFDRTDIAFTNAFMDPDVVSNIRGNIDGELKVTGSPNHPVLEGSVELQNAGAKIQMLGAEFSMNGPIDADEYGFYINGMPVTDQEGNSGSVVGSIYHENFEDWNFDLSFNLEEDAYKRDPIRPWIPQKLDRFMVLNTSYKEGELYYGKAYVTGTANIFGYSDNLEITVNVGTEKGTWVNFPMYGSGEITEGESYITFKSKDTTVQIEAPKFDFTGVTMDLNFDVTPDAKMKIIFNEQLGDEITATGSGNIAIGLNNIGDVTLDGVYTVKDGVYNFALGPIKQNFYIAEGGSITWTGDPYTANLDMRTYYKVNASLYELSPDQQQGVSYDVFCYLDLKESLLKPNITFDLQVPKAPESGKTLINSINSDQDELNRQFFSLLLWKRFQPMKGSAVAGGGGALDLVTNQINSMLNQFSKDYKLNLNVDADNITNDKSLEFGVSKGFLDDRLVLTGSFGVENVSAGEQSHSALIGDVNLEYKLNDAGTFRVNIFNESNDYSVINDKNLGQFTQGVGLHYQEDFNDVRDFKVIQYFLDIFRKKENKRYPVKRKRRQTPVPPKEQSWWMVIEDELEYS